jgi:hypothetical protein
MERKVKGYKGTEKSKEGMTGWRQARKDSKPFRIISLVNGRF